MSAIVARGFCIALALTLAPCMRQPARSAPAPRPLAPAPASDSQVMVAPVVIDASVIDAGTLPMPVTLALVIEAVRREDWRTARERLLRLPESEQNTREGRYLGGRLAAVLGDDARAVTLLHDLGTEIPALAAEITRLEAQVLAHAGRHAEARTAYQQLATRTHRETDRGLAAEEALAAGDNAAAAAAMRTWSSDPPAGLDRARAWRHAAQALEAVGDAAGAIRAWKRIVIDEPDTGAVTQAREALTRLGASLDTGETLARAANLNSRARYVESIAELTALPAGRGSSEARRLHLLGRAQYWSRSRYAEAQVTLSTAAARPENSDREEDGFLAARSLGRANRNNDAIAAYDQVARTTRGRWGDEAAFRAAWIVAHDNQIDAAVTRLRTFLSARTDASATLRTEAAWELGWVLYQANRFAEAAPELDRSAEMAARALEKGRGRYWSAMARLRGGDRTGGIEGFRRVVADKPITYYAMLAELRLRERSETVALPAEPAPRRPAPAIDLPENVRWLRALGFEREGGALLAAQEDTLRSQLPHDRADEVIALAYLELGEEYRAYTLAQRHNDSLDHEPTAETRWIWDCAYPRPYAHWVEAAETANHLPRHYLYAIMRQESAFNGRDVSNARAIGLLQMIPPTTRRVAQEMGIPYREEMLFEPEYNIQTGAHYIGRLFAQYNGVLPRAIGAFNAGPGAMNGFVRRWPDAELDVFVERIPYDETRTYVRRVMQNLARYRYLYGPRGDGWPMRLELTTVAAVGNVVDY